MEHKEAVKEFYAVYWDLRDKLNLTHHTLMTEKEGLIEVWRGDILAFQIKDEDQTNIWIRATGYLKGMAERCGCTGATEK